MRNVRDADAVLNASFSVEDDEGRLAMTIESRSGARGSPNARNPDYDPALELLLARLGDLNAEIVDAQVFSTAALRDYPDPEQRRLELAGGYPVAVALREPRELRREFARSQRKVARAPDLTSSGNNNKRVRFWIELPGHMPAEAQALEAELAGDMAFAGHPARANSQTPGGETTLTTRGRRAKYQRGQGYASDPAVRRAVELHAMRLATEHFVSEGWEVEDTSADRPYDLRCTRNDEELRVEVKGTTGLGQQIHLTAGEVEHARAHPDRVALFVVAGVAVTGHMTGEIVTFGGTPRLISPWDIDAGELRATAYDWQPQATSSVVTT